MTSTKSKLTCCLCGYGAFRNWYGLIFCLDCWEGWR